MDPNENAKNQWKALDAIAEGVIAKDRDAVSSALEELEPLLDAMCEWLAGGGFVPDIALPPLEAISFATQGVKPIIPTAVIG